jgi:hypothetical protein
MSDFLSAPQLYVMRTLPVLYRFKTYSIFYCHSDKLWIHGMYVCTSVCMFACIYLDAYGFCMFICTHVRTCLFKYVIYVHRCIKVKVFRYKPGLALGVPGG